MSKELEQIVERIGQLPDDAEMSNTAIGLDPLAVVPSFFTTDDLKALATAYTKAISDLAKAKAGLGHYAESCDCGHLIDNHDELGECTLCDCTKITNHAQQVLDEIGKE